VKFRDDKPVGPGSFKEVDLVELAEEETLVGDERRTAAAAPSVSNGGGLQIQHM